MPHRDRAASLKQVLEILEPERIEIDRFRAHSLDLKWGYVFGGQFLAQSLVVAEQTVREDQAAHSVHGHFLQSGDEHKPITYEVARVRDGKSFATRRVDAIQNGRTIFTLTASFHREEPGFEHQDPMPQVPGPEGLLSQAEIARKHIDRMSDRIPNAAREQLSFEGAIEVRPVDPIGILNAEAIPPLRSVWYRALGTLPDRPVLHRALLAYVSDLNLLGTVLRPHALTSVTPGLYSTSLDHALWFHRPFRMDEWLLFVMNSPSASGARGLTGGRFFTQDGCLVASAAQEGLIRTRS
ncbi:MULTISPECIES: acyl-CoA thioesterase [Bradyrhizobium]|uniref:acyl-CoA thioesterase n=1 Tax=Bradyrhizobium centrosematis TaxID=1300039 RepID=UPI0021672E08|nr:acyl-CoA thioesterase II [Bradyrhizobium centrosematis]MCS3765899.1 acyl-CoA thioesterase-2 [Bradyrhizobium centrosematis]MCS3778199.1 acyl-CoA thioesterase-2 [Bradyrhizobium centrosematis]